MSLINPTAADSQPRPERRGPLRIGGRSYDNAASKFWPALLDEVQAGYPACSSLELRAASGEALGVEQLYPQIDLLQGLDSIMDKDLSRLRRDTLAEMLMLGPPPAVRLRLLSGPRAIHTADLPSDVIDADILPHMVVWLLEWAGIAHDRWNEDFVSGRFHAVCISSGRGYRVAVSVRRRHIHEGLYERVVTLCPMILDINSRG